MCLVNSTLLGITNVDQFFEGVKNFFAALVVFFRRIKELGDALDSKWGSEW